MAKLKNLYVGQFPFKFSLYVERCYAYSKKQAFYILCGRIAKKKGVPVGLVMDYFKHHGYELETEFNFKEEG